MSAFLRLFPCVYGDAVRGVDDLNSYLGRVSFRVYKHRQGNGRDGLENYEHGRTYRQ